MTLVPVTRPDPVPAPTGAGGAPVLAAVRVVPAALAALGLIAVVYALADVRASALHDVRIVVTTVFLLLGPGWALAAFLRGRSLAERFVLAAASGVAMSILAGQVMVVAGVWHPGGLLYLVAALTVPLLIRHAARAA